jgi:hypothetical protein
MNSSVDFLIEPAIIMVQPLKENVMSKLYSDIPSDLPCYIVNEDLWEIFSNVYKSENNIRPDGTWTEAEVVQYLDLRDTNDLVLKESEYDFYNEHELERF